MDSAARVPTSFGKTILPLPLEWHREKGDHLQRAGWLAILLLAAFACPLNPATASAATRANAVVTANDRGGNGASNGIPDEFTLIRRGAFVDMYQNGIRSRSWRLGSLNSLTVNGSNDDDTLTVDFSGGNPMPSGGLYYNGGDNGPAGDTLRLTGGALDNVAYTFFNRTDGAVDINGRRIVYTGLEPVVDTVPSLSLTVNATNAPNAITYQRNGSNGEVAIDNSEVLDFSNKVALTINGFAGDDHIDLDAGAFTPTALTSIVVNCGPGNDVVSVAAGTQVPITINGDDADDLFRVSPPAGATITVDGGDHVVGDHLLVVAGASKAKNTGTAVVVDGFMNVNYSNLQRVDIVTKSNLKKFLP